MDFLSVYLQKCNFFLITAIRIVLLLKLVMNLIPSVFESDAESALLHIKLNHYMGILVFLLGHQSFEVFVIVH